MGSGQLKNLIQDPIWTPWVLVLFNVIFVLSLSPLNIFFQCDFAIMISSIFEDSPVQRNTKPNLSCSQILAGYVEIWILNLTSAPLLLVKSYGSHREREMTTSFKRKIGRLIEFNSINFSSLSQVSLLLEISMTQLTLLVGDGLHLQQPSYGSVKLLHLRQD